MNSGYDVAIMLDLFLTQCVIDGQAMTRHVVL